MKQRTHTTIMESIERQIAAERWADTRTLYERVYDRENSDD